VSERSARGFVLDRRPFREHDLRVDVLLDDGDRAELLCPSGQRSRVRFAGGLTPLVLHTLAITPYARGLRLDEARIERTWPALHRDLTRQTAALAGTGLLREVADASPGDRTAFLLLGELYEDLAALPSGQCPARLLRFVMEALTHAGHAPVLDRCVRCQTEVPPERAVTVEPSAGGVVCRGCGGGRFRLSAVDRAELRAVLAGDLTRYVSGMVATMAVFVEGVAPVSGPALARAAELFDRPAAPRSGGG
jgi:DNA repair protein RecO (recombination protein O)